MTNNCLTGSYKQIGASSAGQGAETAFNLTEPYTNFKFIEMMMAKNNADGSSERIFQIMPTAWLTSIGPSSSSKKRFMFNFSGGADRRCWITPKGPTAWTCHKSGQTSESVWAYVFGIN